MTDTPPIDPRGPILLCAGTEPAAATHLAEMAVGLLADRPAVVLATWPSLPLAGAGRELTVDADAGILGAIRDAARRAAEATARAAADVLEATGAEVTVQVCPEERSPWQAILAAADEHGAALVVAGSSDGGPSGSDGLGRDARALAHRIRRPLLLMTPASARPGTDAPAIFATDGSSPARHAVAAGGALLRPRAALAAAVWQSVGATVDAARLGVPDVVAREGAERLDEAARARAAGEAGESADLLAAAGWAAEALAVENAQNVTATIVRLAAERDAAVIVTGTRGRSRIAAALLGSTAEGILRHAGRPVLLVPPVADE